MALSIFDLFKIGVGPSSSHTVGPMVAANRFVAELRERGLMDRVAAVKVSLFGSLAMTGKGHATDIAAMLGLLGERPDLVEPARIDDSIAQIRTSGTLLLAGERAVPFREADHLRFHFGESLPKHPNGMRLEVLDAAGLIFYSNVYYSVGGGFVLSDAEANDQGRGAEDESIEVPYPFNNAIKRKGKRYD